MRIERLWTQPVRTGLWLVANRAMEARRRELRQSGAGEHLDLIASTFLLGYRAALDSPRVDATRSRLDAVPNAHRGFAYEGAAMALALMDAVVPPGGRRRFEQFIGGAGSAHVYMAHVGAGWAAARLHRPLDAARRGLDPLLGWLAIDGYGFHHGYFHSEPYVRRHRLPRGAHGYTAHVFDQGLGRSLWFVDGADVHRIAETIFGFAPARHADLWSGAALAAAYAGGVSDDSLRAFKALARGYDRNLAQAVAFAAEARGRAGNPAPHTERACVVLAGISAGEAAALARDLAAGSCERPERPAYEHWRQRVGAAVVDRASAQRPAEAAR